MQASEMNRPGHGGPIALYSQVGGSGARTLLLLHGLFGASANLGAVARHLQAQHYRVVRCDLRNHGRSPHAGAMDYALMAADVVRLLDSLNIERCALLGHSMGGKVAMQLALAHPDRVAALIVADIAPIGYAHDRHDAVFAALQAVPLQQLTSRGQAETAMRPFLAESGVRQFLLSNLYRRDGEFHWRFNLAALYANRGNLALAPPEDGRYTGPVLFIKGSLSNYIGEQAFPAIKARFPQARLHLIQGAGHWVHADKPAAFNAAVSRFCARVYPVG